MNTYNVNLYYQPKKQNINNDIQEIVSRALLEDLGGNTIDVDNDITSRLLPKDDQVHAQIVTHEDGIFCGKQWVEEIFNQLNSKIILEWHVQDSQNISAKQILCDAIGPSRILVSAERTILNFIQMLSGVATKVNKYVNLLINSNTQLLDTRKTLPGLRTALKYAVVCGGGKNHRQGLYDAFLIKENHITAIGSIGKAIKKASSIMCGIPIEIEVESLNEFMQALEANANIILLDNFNIKNIYQAVKINKKRNKKRVLLEASGNINENNIMQIAETGVDYISVGSLTKHIHSLDFSMKFV
ncbi:MAG: carboxylating nicotinate-nucleotide diphosphorylase [Pantoea sp. Brub]|nr:carboxylating nicotinate-nucleotide diphosphorylase [Pantoea sp. Brub]